MAMATMWVIKDQQGVLRVVVDEPSGDPRRVQVTQLSGGIRGDALASHLSAMIRTFSGPVGDEAIMRIEIAS